MGPLNEPREAEPLSRLILIAAYDPRWPRDFERQAAKIRAALGPRALALEHTGSTSVPGLAAKPVIDILLVVADSADEDSYAPALAAVDYALRIREPDWHEHRMFKGVDPEVNLHVFSAGCPEIDRILLFRDWLRTHPDDRELYQQTKLDLARRDWRCVQDYADSKTGVIREILDRAINGV